MRRKSNIYSLILSIVLFVPSAVLAIKARLDIEALAGSENGEGFAALGLAIVMALFMVIAIVSGVAMVFKILQVAAGWKFFGFLCVLIDLAAIVVLSYYTFGSVTDFASFDFEAAIPSISLILALVGSFGANISSLKG